MAGWAVNACWNSVSAVGGSPCPRLAVRPVSTHQKLNFGFSTAFVALGKERGVVVGGRSDHDGRRWAWRPSRRQHKPPTPSPTACPTFTLLKLT